MCSEFVILISHADRIRVLGVAKLRLSKLQLPSKNRLLCIEITILALPDDRSSLNQIPSHPLESSFHEFLTLKGSNYNGC